MDWEQAAVGTVFRHSKRARAVFHNLKRSDGMGEAEYMARVRLVLPLADLGAAVAVEIEHDAFPEQRVFFLEAWREPGPHLSFNRSVFRTFILGAFMAGAEVVAAETNDRETGVYRQLGFTEVRRNLWASQKPSNFSATLSPSEQVALF